MTTTPRPGPSTTAAGPWGPRLRRALGLAAALVLSLLLHAWLLAWLGSRPELAGEARALRNDPVIASLLSSQATMQAPPAASAPAPAPRPRTARAPRTAPRPTAITAPPAPGKETPPEPVESEPPAAEATPAQVPEPPVRTPAPVADAAPPAAEPSAAAAPPEPAKADERPARPPLVFGTALPAPPTGRWQFRVYYGDYSENRPVAVLDYLIEHDGERYRLRTEGRAEGLTALLYSGVLTQASGGRLTENGLQPERFVEQRGKRAERWAAADWSRGEIAFSGGERAAIVPGLQDRLSVLVQLGLLARAAPDRFAAGRSVEIDEMTLRDVERVRYASRGDEALETDTGTLRTLHLERAEPRKRDDPVVEIWLGYDLGLIPVRIRMTDVGGRILDQLLVR